MINSRFLTRRRLTLYLATSHATGCSTRRASWRIPARRERADCRVPTGLYKTTFISASALALAWPGTPLEQVSGRSERDSVTSTTVTTSLLRTALPPYTRRLLPASPRLTPMADSLTIPTPCHPTATPQHLP